jgi:diketogulonate reductase-like aldo/keto reductase
MNMNKARSFLNIAVTVFVTTQSAAAIPEVPTLLLGNTAIPGLTIPAIGLGTGAYSDVNLGNASSYPECWTGNGGAGGGAGSCGLYVRDAVTAWLQAGGRRIDAANSYQDQVDVGIAMNNFINSGAATREEIFLLSKVGPSHPLGGNDVKAQFQGVLSDMNVSYVDLLLVHWPWFSASKGNVTQNVTVSTTPACNNSSPEFSEKYCRLDTWKGMLDIYASGQVRAIGVSNYNVSHFEEIIEAGLPLPALTQSPFHLYRASTQADLLIFCAKHGITFLGYSPFGVPDYHTYTFPNCPSSNQLEHPYVLSLAQKYNVTPAQVLIQWQWQIGIPVNPRSVNPQHMLDNLNTYSVFQTLGGLNETEVNTLFSQPQDFCSPENTWYECAPPQDD